MGAEVENDKIKVQGRRFFRVVYNGEEEFSMYKSGNADKSLLDYYGYCTCEFLGFGIVRKHCNV
jgi:hypothetical protein